MVFDATIHLGDLLVCGGFAFGGWRIGIAFRDEIRGLRQTVYGSVEPPVEGLVKIAERHEKFIDGLLFSGKPRGERHGA